MTLNGLRSIYMWHDSQPIEDELNGIEFMCVILFNLAKNHP
jgi:hypothetical protein